MWEPFEAVRWCLASAGVKGGKAREVFKFSRLEQGLVRRCSESHGAGRVGSGHPEPIRPA